MRDTISFYTFMFSIIIGELIRATKGRTIYIALVFHASMSFAQVFLFSEETGDLFSMKVIALSTTLVGIVFIILSLIIRFIVYKQLIVHLMKLNLIII